MPHDAIIQVRGLTARYGDAVVLEDVSFEVKRSEIFVILGGSGCGKTTLLKHMIGLHRPHQGQALIDGENLAAAEGADRERILKKFGVLFQGAALLGSMTLAENVALPVLEHTDLPREAVDFIVRMKLRMVHLSGFENHLPSELSGGMRKRAGLARAMALDPSLLFFDEPSAGLDPVTSAGLDHLILQIRASLGTTMVVVTHELPSIFTIADRCIMLDARRKGILAEGTPAELRDTSDDPWVRDFFQRRSHTARAAAET